MPLPPRWKPLKGQQVKDGQIVYWRTKDGTHYGPYTIKRYFKRGFTVYEDDNNKPVTFGRNKQPVSLRQDWVIDCLDVEPDCPDSLIGHVGIPCGFCGWFNPCLLRKFAPERLDEYHTCTAVWHDPHGKLWRCCLKKHDGGAHRYQLVK